MCLSPLAIIIRKRQSHPIPRPMLVIRVLSATGDYLSNWQKVEL